MESIRNLLLNRKINKAKTNKIWLISEEIATVTNSTPQRWLRQVKKNPDYMLIKLANFKEILKISTPKHRLSLFLWLLKH